MVSFTNLASISTSWADYKNFRLIYHFSLLCPQADRKIEDRKTRENERINFIDELVENERISALQTRDLT